MSDDDNTNNQVPRVVKGTGFYTPMDLAPGEAPGEVTVPTPEQSPPEAPQTSDGNTDATSEE